MNLSSPTPRFAVVLAGAGAAGNAWQIGIAAGLADAGIDLRTADLIVGTSAGSTAAAQITGSARLIDLYTATIDAIAPPPPHREPGAGTGRQATISGPDYLRWSDALIEASEDAADMRRRFGAAALEADTSKGAASSRWRDIVAARLQSHDWPQQRVLITAVDARSGEPVVFDRSSGVSLVDAVAASTSAMMPFAIGDARYINGGYRRGSNADLAAGHDRVLILEPFSGRSRTPGEWGLDLATQVEELRAGGSMVTTVFPDAGAGDVFNANALDPATRAPAARGGFAQGSALAGTLLADGY